MSPDQQRGSPNPHVAATRDALRRLETERPDPGRAAEPGDLFVLPQTSRLPVEWAMIERDAARPGLLLAVPADTNPLAGSADVEVPAGAASGPLTLRCRFGVSLAAGSLDPKLRTGALEPESVRRAQRKLAEIARGTVAASPRNEEADRDPEYQDWIAEVLVPARSAVSAPVIRKRGRIRTGLGSLGNPYALAASALLLVGLGWAGGWWWRQGEITDTVAQRRRIEEQSARTARRAEERERDLARRLERSTASERAARERIAELERQPGGSTGPLVNLPFVWLAPRETVRGEPNAVSLPADAPVLLLLLDAGTGPGAEYRLEIVRRDTGKVVWDRGGLKKTGLAEIALTVPRSLLPPGEYRLRLFGLSGGKSELTREYDLAVRP